MLNFKNIIFTNKYLSFAILSSLAVFFIALNVKVFHSIFLGIILFILFFSLNSITTGKIINHFIKIETFLKNLFGFLSFFYLLTFVGTFFVVLFVLTENIILIILLLLPWTIYLLNIVVRKKNILTQSTNEHEQENITPIKISRYLVLILPFLFFICFYFLFLSRTDQFIDAPWDVVPKIFFLFVFLVVFIVFLVIFSQLKTKKILLIIVSFSILIHSALAIIYVNGYGGDKWRHLANEQKIADNKIITPSLIGENIAKTKIGPLSIPTVFLVGNKNSYANLWSITVIIAKILQINFFYIDLYLGFMLWSVFCPLLFYQIGKYFFPTGKILPLLFAFFILFPNIIVNYGSFTSPVSFGFLLFIFCFLFLINAQADRQNKYKIMTISILAIILYFNYIYTFILWFLIILVYFTIKYLTRSRNFKGIFTSITIGLSFIVAATIIYLDIFYGKIFNLGTGLLCTSNQGIITLFFEWIKKISGYSIIENYSDLGKYGNLFFQWKNFYPLNSIPLYLVCIFLLVTVSVIGIKKIRDQKIRYCILIFTTAFLAIMFISQCLLSRPHPISNRTNVPFFIILSPIWAIGFYYLFIYLHKVFNKKYVLLVLSLAFSVIFVYIYSDNSKELMVTKSELNAAKYINNQIKSAGLEKNKCVIGDVAPLLALQAVSGNNIKGGGFPMGEEFNQDELYKLQKKILSKYNIKYLEKAMQITNSQSCYLIVKDTEADINVLSQMQKVMFAYKKIGDINIFYFKK